jgi:hypothetical protein
LGCLVDHRRAPFATAGIAGLISRKQVGQASPTPEKAVANIKEDINEVKDARRDR